MATPRPLGTERQPPLTASSSLQSMNGKERSPPPFKDFVARSSPISDDQKPLPARPVWTGRASSNSPPRSRTPSRVVGRRSSSIYSRTVSQWDSDNFSWRSADFADDPMPPVPPIPTFRPLRYSVSTPHLAKDLPVAPPLQPRTFSPLIRTPSPTSKATTPGFAQDSRTTIWPGRGSLSPKLWPGALHIPPASKRHVRTISLEKANAAVHAPGAIHLLPEEHRANNARRSWSDEALRVAPSRIQPRLTNSGSDETPTLIDKQGRRRTLVSSADTHPIGTEYPFPVMPSTDRNYFRVGTGPERQMIPLATQQREASRDKATQALGIGEFDEPRGRTRHRGPRRLDYTHYMPGTKQNNEDLSPEGEPEAQKLAKEYHSLLSEQYRQPSVSSGYHSAGSDDRVKTYMKMVPQPLFNTKPPPKTSGDLTRVDSMRATSTGTSRSSDGSTFKRDGDMVPLKLSVSLQSGHSRQTTSGTIPISPPEPLLEDAFVPILSTPSPPRKKALAAMKKPKDSRVSAYYPHVTPRKGIKARKTSKSSETSSDIPPMPFLSSPIGSEESSSLILKAKPSVRKDSAGKLRQKSDASSDKARNAIHKRLMKGAANIITNLERSELSDSEHVKPAVAVRGSPHLLPTLVSAKSKDLHLGWSDVAKNTFDNLVSPGGLTPANSSPRSGASQFIHVVGPPRPLDESRAGLSQPDSPRRKSSVFGGFMGSWKESKAEKRREELKKLIKYVPQEETTSRRRTSVVFGWM